MSSGEEISGTALTPRTQPMKLGQKRRCPSDDTFSEPAPAKATGTPGKLDDTETASDDEVQETYVILDVPSSSATPDALAKLSSASFDFEVHLIDCA